MDVLCLYCERLTPLLTFRVVGDLLFIRCEHCQLEPCAERRDEAWHARLRALGEAEATSEPAKARPDHCPKCVEPRAPGPSCPSCGVVFSQFRPESMRLSGRLQSLWEDARSRPQDDGAQRRLLEVATETGALPLVGRLYRLALRDNPRDIPALVGLAAVRASTLDVIPDGSAAVPAPRRANGLQWVLLVGAGILVGLLGWSFR